METDLIIKERIDTILPILNKRQRRIYLATEAISIGWGGKSKIANLSSVARRTIAKGEKDAVASEIKACKSGIRKKGGGRKKATSHQPEMLKIIEDIGSPHTMGDPMNPLKWTSKIIRKITAELQGLGFAVCHEVVSQCLIGLGYSLQANKKIKEGGNSPDSDAQFVFINDVVKEFA